MWILHEDALLGPAKRRILSLCSVSTVEQKLPTSKLLAPGHLLLEPGSGCAVPVSLCPSQSSTDTSSG